MGLTYQGSSGGVLSPDRGWFLARPHRMALLFNSSHFFLQLLIVLCTWLDAFTASVICCQTVAFCSLITVVLCFDRSIILLSANMDTIICSCLSLKLLFLFFLTQFIIHSKKSQNKKQSSHKSDLCSAKREILGNPSTAKYNFCIV